MFQGSNGFTPGVERANITRFEVGNKTSMKGSEDSGLPMQAVGGRMSQRTRVSIDEFGRRGQQLMTRGTLDKYKALDVSLAQASYNSNVKRSEPPVVASARK